MRWILLCGVMLTVAGGSAQESDVAAPNPLPTVEMPAAASSPASTRELPDVPTLLKAVEAHAKELEATVRNYIFRRTDEVLELDKTGKVKSTETMEYEVYFVAGHSIERLISKNGKPLNEKETRKQDKEIANREKKAREAKEKPEDNEITPAKFIAADEFYNLRREVVGGRDLLAFDFRPRPEYKGSGISGKVLKVLEGTIWIDEGAREIVKLHAHLGKGFKVGAGLASISEGASIVFENARINDEVWLPSAGEVNFGFRVLFSRKRMNVKFRYSDYRKFGSESRITEVKETEGPAAE